MGQVQQPDFNVNTNSAIYKFAAISICWNSDTMMDWGPALKMGGEVDGSLYLSSDQNLEPSKEGASYRFHAESFNGPFHLLGKVDGTSPNFVNIGNPLVSGNYLDWNLQGDYKDKSGLFAQLDRTFQRTFTSGPEDNTTTDHGEFKAKPKGFPETDYIYYQSNEEILNSLTPFHQDDLRNTLSLLFNLPGNLSMKTSALQESQTGNNLGENDSYGGGLEVSTQKWKNFNFSVSGEWRLNNIMEASSNTLVPTTMPGNNIFSQTYTYIMVGMPVTHLTLTGKGTYTNAPPGPAKADLTETFKTDPYKWLTAGGSYSLDFQQTTVLGSNSPDQVNTRIRIVRFNAVFLAEIHNTAVIKIGCAPGLWRTIIVQEFPPVLQGNFKPNLREHERGLHLGTILDLGWFHCGFSPELFPENGNCGFIGQKTTRKFFGGSKL